VSRLQTVETAFGIMAGLALLAFVHSEDIVYLFFSSTGVLQAVALHAVRSQLGRSPRCIDTTAGTGN